MTLTEIERSKLHHLLVQDPIWSAYALADLQPEFDSYCQWFHEEGGVVLVFSGLEPPAFLTIGTTVAVAKTLETVALPEQVYVSAKVEHYPLLEERYDLTGDARAMFRMSLQDVAALKSESRAAAVHLTRNDEAEIAQLLNHGGSFTPDGYDPYQLDNGFFCGIRDANGLLIAMGGTHIVDWKQGIGAIGNMYTHPDHRGQGYGSAILQNVVTALLDGGVSNIVLNVDQRNEGAQRIYRKLGFEIHCPFIEGVGKRIDDFS